MHIGANLMPGRINEESQEEESDAIRKYVSWPFMTPVFPVADRKWGVTAE